MDVVSEISKPSRSVAFVSGDEVEKFQEIKDSMALMAKSFGKALKWKLKFQCYECNGYGHLKSECPITKRKELKCHECRGIRHTRAECPNLQKNKEKSFISVSYTESEEDKEGEDFLNFLAFLGDGAKETGEANSDIDDENDSELDPKMEFRKLYDSWIVLSNEKLQLTKDKLMLEANVNILEIELEQDTGKRAQKSQQTQDLEAKVKLLQENLSQALDKNKALEQEVNDDYRKVRMLNKGTKRLDQMFASGRTEKQFLYGAVGVKEQITNSFFTEPELICSLAMWDTVEASKTSVVAFTTTEGKIQGKGSLDNLNQPRLINVYYVEGLKANLISGVVILHGTRAHNNSYMWKDSDVCLSAVTSELDLWHKRLGHMNIESLARLVSAKSVREFPRLESKTQMVCGACAKGKQIRVQHKKVADVGTKRILELVHMDLIGPVQTESIAGRRYIFVLVDDFSRFTWDTCIDLTELDVDEEIFLIDPQNRQVEDLPDDTEEESDEFYETEDDDEDLAEDDTDGDEELEKDESD
ncbi:uncharacterized protein LOC112082159 [Eutrema salsugineum]|uniref:uncharacterized protein LOC112082159 n=1 Tax=Eutrema salsugineum TaxID=72664 RepID=UPI000CED344A|nr:uncharacterized protein LOC112082159 [Eutrema salsugineum]